jgi:L-seryl-tRNA(Ser) seleniumtransferase
MSFYESLGVSKRINAAAYYTALGGSIMSADVISAMNDASKSFISMHDLQLKAGKKIAKLTKNEGAYITSGAGAAIALSILAFRTKGDINEIQKIINGTSGPSEVIIQCGHRIPYDPAIGLAGSKIVVVGNAIQTFEYELEAAINSNTTAIFYVAGAHLATPTLSIETVVSIARKHKVPVVVDAAAQLPPLSNLWKFTAEDGADLVIFSGGKTLKGPASTGLILGKSIWIEAVRANGAPFQRIARAFKVGKEEIAGIVTAVEQYVNLDHAAEFTKWEMIVDTWVNELSMIPKIRVIKEDLNEAGQPIPRVGIHFSSNIALDAIAKLQELDPIVEVVHNSRNTIWLSADGLQKGEETMVTTQVKKALAKLNL